MMQRMTLPGDMHTVASWIDVAWCVCDEGGLCCDVSTCGSLAGTFRADERIDARYPDTVTCLWSSDATKASQRQQRDR